MGDTRLERTINLLKSNPEYVDALRKILEYQEREFKCKKCGARDFERISRYIYKCKRCGTENIIVGFTSTEVGVRPHIMQKLVYDGLVKVLSKTSRRTDYILDLNDEPMIRVALKAVEEESPEVDRVPELPPDLFANIVGYDDVKAILRKAFYKAFDEKGKPTAILLIGPPASAKSMFLEELSRIEGAYLILAGTTTKAGLRDIIIENEPKILLIDELDKINSSRDLSVLLSVIDPGHIIVTMHGKKVKKKVRIWVVAACNKTKNIPPELLSRFLKFRFREYNEEELRRIIVYTVKERLGKPQIAEYVADKVIEIGARDPRVAINIAKLADTKEEVDFLIESLKKYR